MKDDDDETEYFSRLNRNILSSQYIDIILKVNYI